MKCFEVTVFTLDFSKPCTQIAPKGYHHISNVSKSNEVMK